MASQDTIREHEIVTLFAHKVATGNVITFVDLQEAHTRISELTLPQLLSLTNSLVKGQLHSESPQFAEIPAVLRAPHLPYLIQGAARIIANTGSNELNPVLSPALFIIAPEIPLILDNLLSSVKTHYLLKNLQAWGEVQIASLFVPLATLIASQPNIELIDNLLDYLSSLYCSSSADPSVDNNAILNIHVKTLNKILLRNPYFLSSYSVKNGLDPTLPADWLRELVDNPIKEF